MNVFDVCSVIFFIFIEPMNEQPKNDFSASFFRQQKLFFFFVSKISIVEKSIKWDEHHRLWLLIYACVIFKK